MDSTEDTADTSVNERNSLLFAYHDIAVTHDKF